MIKTAFEIIRLCKNWPTVIMDASGMLGKENTVVYKLRNGLVFNARTGTNDVGVLINTFIIKENDPFVSDLKPNPVIVDIGGHIGIVTSYFAHMRPDARIYTFEPLKENFNLLERNIFQRNVKIINRAVSNANGWHKFYYNEGFQAGASLVYGLTTEKQVYKTTKVRCINAKDMLKIIGEKGIDLLKIDVEGYDLTLLRNFGSLLRKVQAVHAECLSQEDKRETIKLLEKYGFSCITKQYTDYYGMIYGIKK